MYFSKQSTNIHIFFITANFRGVFKCRKYDTESFLFSNRIGNSYKQQIQDIISSVTVLLHEVTFVFYTK